MAPSTTATPQVVALVGVGMATPEFLSPPKRPQIYDALRRSSAGCDPPGPLLVALLSRQASTSTSTAPAPAPHGPPQPAAPISTPLTGITMLVLAGLCVES